MDTLDLNTVLSIRKDEVLRALNCIREATIFAKIFPSKNCKSASELFLAINENDFQMVLKILKNNNIHVTEYKTYRKNIIGMFYEKTWY
ncbi:MAG: hypothetical protein ACOC80_01235 [Petrotogales bacterium]